MGCSASVYTNDLDNQTANGHTNEHTEGDQQDKIEQPSSPEQKTSTTSTSLPPLIYGLRPPMKEVQAPIAFEVSGQDEDDKNVERVSIIQTYPPKRLRRLEEDQVNISSEEVQRRLELAEKRRSEILQMRVQSARMSARRGPKRPQLTPMVSE